MIFTQGNEATGDKLTGKGNGTQVIDSKTNTS